jgi:hypothetical protein
MSSASIRAPRGVDGNSACTMVDLPAPSSPLTMMSRCPQIMEAGCCEAGTQRVWLKPLNGESRALSTCMFERWRKSARAARSTRSGAAATATPGNRLVNHNGSSACGYGELSAMLAIPATRKGIAEPATAADHEKHRPGSAAGGACFAYTHSGELNPVAPPAAPDPLAQDRNMALTWTFGAPGRIRTRDPLLRKSFRAGGQPALAQVEGGSGSP